MKSLFGLLKIVTLSVFIMATFFSCGVKEEEPGSNTEELKDREYLLANYSDIVGKYVGHIEQDASAIPVELNIYIVEVQEGIDENGSIKFRPTLRGQYRRTDIVDEYDSEVLDIRYYPENGNIIMSSINIKTQTKFLSFEGTLSKGQMVVSAIKNGGAFGQLKAKIMQKNPNVSYQSTEVDKRSRLRAVYEPIKGTYYASIDGASARMGRSYDFEISVFIIEVESGVNSNGEPSFVPKLMARYRTLNFIGEDDNQLMAVRFYPETDEIVMKSISNSRFTIRGVINENTITKGEIIKDGGLLGTFISKRYLRTVSVSRLDPEEEKRERIKAVYEKIVGDYSGPVMNNEVLVYNAVVKIFIVEEVAGINSNGEGIMLPALRARIIKQGDDSGILDRFLSVKYFAQTEQISMANLGQMNSNVPGAGLYTLTGNLRDGVLAAAIMDHRGFVGDLKASKK
ncbi:MAG: hypothetical protein A2504_04280 [Bdellovibrionales bacterium RIFOXYD12_FULL_39_22]|nr:MAG: hypothetical protein A2385_07545 [Bdellovibrionales bacterium RIFOXYB1_FULL_39_21]OFZ42113.1 MAG: hypothetical protein A2485_09515 [Bdellovibrionales bacterium RIFOXYC12_FULL_39_17]OFZ50829.1 MAG: hypothetical protein A2404_06465 [Bdellovibrionales bacterium RIFOXYC1_FULL_39_130]OFZ73608.1 MAG: hypothetical protein A2451_06250 [Bdellovibrionales bacterium RIFOXYC2_FULL_39_8]OFZ78052.1 MAG: hypothetical protein A2560_01635 [Bdellovibrionales bacterium RIFOXYD1_FULL_39_84]OFZ93512.1 MAG: